MWKNAVYRKKIYQLATNITKMAGRKNAGGEGSSTGAGLPSSVDTVFPKTCCTDGVTDSMKHDQENQFFYIDLLDGQEKMTSRAILQYTLDELGVADLWHTEVPPSFRGKGVAKLLAKAAFDYVVQGDLKMKLTCTYLQKYYSDNPLSQYTERIVPL